EEFEKVTLWHFLATPIHGSIDEASVYTDQERVLALSEIGRLRVADPAVDLAAASALIDPAALPTFFEEYLNSRPRADEHVITRAELLAEFAVLDWLLEAVDSGDEAAIEDAADLLVSFNDVLFAAAPGTDSGSAEHRDDASAETPTADDASAGDDEHEVVSDGTNGPADEEGTGVEAAITERDRNDVFIPVPDRPPPPTNQPPTHPLHPTSPLPRPNPLRIRMTGPVRYRDRTAPEPRLAPPVVRPAESTAEGIGACREIGDQAGPGCCRTRSPAGPESGEVVGLQPGDDLVFVGQIGQTHDLVAADEVERARHVGDLRMCPQDRKPVERQLPLHHLEHVRLGFLRGLPVDDLRVPVGDEYGIDLAGDPEPAEDEFERHLHVVG